MNPLRVAAYCRVSTKKEEQEKSLENQQKYFTEIINKNPEWHFYTIYSDEESGTSTRKRKGFLQMMDDASAFKFDLILTKEISRFARNVQDSIQYTEALKRLGIEVRFLTDNINSFDADHELRFNLMSSIYQDESRRTSQRVRWGHQRQMEKGVVFGASVYGYHLKNGKLTINANESKIIRLIFDLYINEGMGAHKIVKTLESKGIPSPTGSPTWKNASVLRMLKNEKYMGTLKQKKQITVDYKTHQRQTNNGEEGFIIIENNHEAIIPPDVWAAVQKEIANRKTKIQNKTNHSNRYWLSGKIKCAHCNATYKRKIINVKDKYHYIVWICAKNSKEGKEKINATGLTVGCNNKPIHESALQDAFIKLLQNTIGNKSELMTSIKSTLYEVFNHRDDSESKIRNEIRRNENRASKLLELFLDNGISRGQYDLQNAMITKQMETLQDELKAYTQTNEEAHTAKLENVNALVENILNFNHFSEELAKALVQKIAVKNRECIHFSL